MVDSLEPRSVMLTAVLPNLGPNPLTVEGCEQEGGEEDTWRVQAFAVCASPIASLEVVYSVGPWGSARTASDAVICPPGKYIYAAGGAIFGEASGEVGFVGLGPQPPSIGWLAAAEDPSGAGPKWHTALVTVCAL